MADTSKDAAIGRRNTPHHSYITVHARLRGSKQVPACVHNIVLTC